MLDPFSRTQNDEHAEVAEAHTMSIESAFREMLRDVVREVVREQLGDRPTELQTELLTYEQAAQHFTISISTLKRWVASSRLKAYGKGKLRRVRSDDVRACMESSSSSAKTNEPDLKASVTSILASVRK